MFLLCGASSDVWAQITVGDSPNVQVLNSSLRTWIDTTGKASVEEVDRLPDTAFVPLPKRKQAPQGPNQAMWVRLDLSTELDRPAWFLSTTQISSDDVRLFSRKALDQRWQKQQAGTQTPVADWPIREARPTFSVMLKQGEVQRFYVRVHDVYGSWTGLQISSAKVHLEKSQYELLLLGMYLGVSVVVLFLGLANWVSSRDALWLSYAAYNTLMTVAQMSLIGLSGMLFFDSWPRMNEFGLYGIIAIAGVAFVLFGVQASQALRFAPVLAKVCLGYTALSTLCIALFWFARTGFVPLENMPLYETVEYLRADFIGQAMIPLTLLSAVCILLMFFVTWRRGYTFSGVGLLVVLVTLISGFPQVAYSLHWIERSWLSEHAFLVGLIFESIAMLFIMQRQSRSLAHTAGRLRHLRLQDALTGLMPRTGALKTLDSILARAQHRGLSVDVLYVQLDNLDAIMREHGHEAADSALLLMARHLTELRQSGDLAARMGSASFMLVPANTTGVDRSTQELREKAAALIAKGLGEHPLLGQAVQLDMRIWIARLEPGLTPAAQAIASLQKRADKPAPPHNSKRIEVIGQI